MPFSHSCMHCKNAFVSPKRAAKFCSMSCRALSNVDQLVIRNKSRRKYPEHPTLTKGQLSYRGRNGVDRLRDVKSRNFVITELGGKCVTCGYSENFAGLVLDHVNGDGGSDRKQKGSRLHRYYAKHIDEARSVLQVLCATCNQIKAYENMEHNRSRRVVNTLAETLKGLK